MEDAIRKKILEQFQRSLKVLKVAIVISGIVFLMNAISFPRRDLVILFVFFLLTPVATWIGAVFVNRILEQRDRIAKFSNFQDDGYF